MPKFAVKDRPLVPGHGNTQGVIINVVEEVPGFPVYTIRWLDDEAIAQAGLVGEGDLCEANPTDADIAADDAAAQERNEAINALVAVKVEEKLSILAAARRKRLRRTSYQVMRRKR